MYKRIEDQIMLPDDFILPFGGKLNPDNRWVRFTSIVPWWDVEKQYAMNFKSLSNIGKSAYSVRQALGSLIIQTRMNLSDKETVEMISENPYMQYLIGFQEFQPKRPFAPSMMTLFRKRLGKGLVNEINSLINRQVRKKRRHKE